MNILHITNELDVGGITTYVLSLAANLKKRGHNVYIASSGGQLLDEFVKAGVVYVPIPIRTKCEAGPKMAKSFLKLLPEVKRNNIELIHSHTRTTRVLADILAKVTGKVHVTTCHGFYKKRFFRRIFPCWGAKVIAISKPVEEYLLKERSLEKGRVKLIYHGMNAEGLKDNLADALSLRRKWGLGAGPLVGITSRLADVKGHSYLIEAMKPVLAEFPCAQLIIVGEGKMKKELVALVEKLGLEKNIFFISTVLDTKEVLSILDVFTIPSLDEGFGLSLMEAMAFGLPCVGSEIGGIKDMLQHGVNGLLVKPGDAKALASAILELLRDRNKAQILGDNARAHINQKFSVSKMVTETGDVYSECLKQKG